MKYILSFFLALPVLCTSLSAVEYGYLKPSDSLVLEDGDILTVLSVAFYDSAYDQKIIDVTLDDGSSYEFGTMQMGSPMIAGGVSNESRIFAGPCSISAVKLFFYKLTRASEVEYKNVNIISLPASAVGQGTHEIVVEASDDLQTWTPVHSSSIGGSKAFFRTRVSLALGAEPAD